VKDIYESDRGRADGKDEESRGGKDSEHSDREDESLGVIEHFRAALRDGLISRVVDFLKCRSNEDYFLLLDKEQRREVQDHKLIFVRRFCFINFCTSSLYQIQFI
jgi:hypothetical protein